MGFIDRKALLAPEALKKEKVDFGQGEFGFVREMTAHEHSSYELLITKEVPVLDSAGKETGATEFKREMEDFRSKLAVFTYCNEKGELQFKPEDYPALAKAIGVKRITKISTVAQKLNNIGEVEKEELVKNSGAGTAGDSSSASA